MLVSEGESGPTGSEIGADGDETGDASVRRALDDGLAVGIEVGEIKVAMGVDEQGTRIIEMRPRERGSWRIY